jgi:hypothetical protein
MKNREKFDVERDEKICSISDSEDPVKIERIRHLIKDSKYVCSTCGRSAMRAENLCAPETL